MSNICLTWVFANGPTEPGQRLVMLALADYADDSGEWCPSMAGIAAKAGMTERGVRGIIRRLEAAGWIEVSIGGGRGGRSKYRLLMTETRNEKPGMVRRVKAENPERGDTKPGTSLHETRNQRSAEPSRTLIYSEAIASGADAPQSVPDPQDEGDLSKQLFDRGVAYLSRRGTPERQARAVIGKWRKTHDDGAIFNAFVAASRAGVVDPVPWITARLGLKATEADRRAAESAAFEAAFAALSSTTPAVAH